MKKCIFVLIAVIAISCNNEQGNISPKKKLPPRNTSINNSNAFNDLFLDSSTLENFITKRDSAGDIGSLLREFYYDRNFEFAWFASDGLTEQARGFWNLYSYHSISEKDTALENKSLEKKMKSLVAEDSLTISANNKNIAQTELLLTEYFIRFLQEDNEKDIENIRQWRSYLPAKKESVMDMAAGMLSTKRKDEWDGTNSIYSSLRDELQTYYDIAKRGGWSTIPPIHKSVKKGKSNPVIPLIKKRLLLTGELHGNDTSALFNDGLEDAVKIFQSKLGYTPTGIISDSLIKDLNIPAQKRVEQLVINTNRMKWMPAKPSGKLIIVNIPEFRLHVYDGSTKAFDMDVVVGKEGRNTVVFTGNLNEIVFSPYWNIPSSIVKNEILPKLQNDPDYLKNENIEITSEENSVPVMRQLPGPKNALGKVKFLFPNSFNIYFHDTPVKNLFQKDKRAYSHGCIRLSDPVKMARYLLQNQKQWTPEKIDSAMNSNQEKYVAIKEPVPVMVTYYTAWIDEGGMLNFRDDLYGHDSLVAAKMFTGH